MKGTLFIQLGRLGDCLQSTPLLASWRKRYPEDSIAILTHDAYRTVFEKNPNVDQVVVYAPPLSLLSDPVASPMEKLTAVRNWMQSLGPSYANVVNLTHDSDSAWLVSWLKPQRVYGTFASDDGRIRVSDPWGIYCLSLHRFRQQNRLNLVDIYTRFSGGSSESESLDFRLGEQDRARIRSWVADGADCTWTVGFQPGAAMRQRRWPAERFIELGKYLGEKYGARVFVFGGPGEEELAGQISDQIAGAQSFAGRTSIPELAELLTTCRFLVTNDTGTMHLATAVGVQVVALYEASAYYRETGPYGRDHWIVQSRNVSEYGESAGPQPGPVLRIPFEEVVFAVDSLVSGSHDETDAREPKEISVDHYRSQFQKGHVDYRPIRKASVSRDVLCGYLQKPVWIASLQESELNCFEAATQSLRDLLAVVPSVPVAQWIQWCREFQSAISQLGQTSGVLKDRVIQLLGKVELDSRYRVPQEELRQLTTMESLVLDNGDSPATIPFVAYFETALAMVGGNDIREYLLEYRDRVLRLEEQVHLFDRILREFSGVLRQQDPASGIETLSSVQS